MKLPELKAVALGESGKVEARIGLTEYEGQLQFMVRAFTRDRLGKIVATMKGINFPVDAENAVASIDDLEKLFAKAFADARNALKADAKPKRRVVEESLPAKHYYARVKMDGKTILKSRMFAYPERHDMLHLAPEKLFAESIRKSKTPITPAALRKLMTHIEYLRREVDESGEVVEKVLTVRTPKL